MSKSVLVSRASLGLDYLQLSQRGRFYLPDGTFGGGETTQKRETSEAPQVKGRYPSSITEGGRTGNVSVHVIATEETLQDEVELVVNAMTQFMYTLIWHWNGLRGVWQCEKADWSLGASGTLDAAHLEVFTQIVHFVVPHNRLSGF